MIITLWSLCLLAAFALTLGYQIRQKITVVNRLDERASLRLIAEAGVKAAIVELAKEPEKTYDSLADQWSNNAEAFSNIKINNGTCSVCYNHISGKASEREIRYGMVDEERKININKEGEDVLERLFKIAAGMDETEAQELAASIIDWRDSDSELSIPLGSAEDSYYRNTQYPYEAKDAEFEFLDEVLLVKGMTKDIFEKTKDYITVYGSGRVNVNTAPRDILLSLGLTEEMADKIISLSCGKDGVTGTADDVVFMTAGEIVPKISQAYRLSDSEIAGLSVVAERSLATKSDNFMVKSVARLDNRPHTTETTAVIDRQDKVLYWQEG